MENFPTDPLDFDADEIRVFEAEVDAICNDMRGVKDYSSLVELEGRLYTALSRLAVYEQTEAAVNGIRDKINHVFDTLKAIHQDFFQNNWVPFPLPEQTNIFKH